jgi:DNA-binding NarL/FixJ family response regulator
MVLRGLASGRRPDEVAERLHLSRSCVSMRIQRAAKALGARTTPQLMYIASSLGLLEGVPRP